MDLRQMCQYYCQKYSNRDFLLSEDKKTQETRKLSFQEFEQCSNQFANYLLTLDVKKGEVVTFLLKNSTEMLVGFIGCVKIGAIFGPINYYLKNEELAYVLNNNHSRVLITCLEFSVDLMSINTKIDHIQHILFIDLIPPKFASTDLKIKFDCYLDVIGIQNKTLDQIRTLNEGEDPACIIYTGGTTGFPKGALLTHKNIRRNVEIMHMIDEGADAPDSITLTPRKYRFNPPTNMMLMPLFHVNSIVAGFMMCLTAGVRIFIPEKFSASNHWRWVEKYRITFFIAVPTVLAILLQRKQEAEPYDHTSLLKINTGGAPLPVSLQKEFQEHFKVPIIPGGLGATETTVVATGWPNIPIKLGSVGKPYKDVQMKIVDESNYQKELKVKEVGEILYKGDIIMKGYYNNPEETKKAIVGDGWFRSGDLGYVDEEGYLFLSGRSKDMIKRGGENIYPVEVEYVISNISGIAEVVVIGKPDPVFGQVSKAIVVLKHPMALSEQEIIDHCKKHLASFKVPVEVEFRNEIPHTDIGKPNKKLLQQEENTKYQT